jgi:hypothetical protein
VRELVGGEVEHSTDEAHAATTMERRMRGLNLMRLEGCIPTLDFWEVRPDVLPSRSCTGVYIPECHVAPLAAHSTT